MTKEFVAADVLHEYAVRFRIALTSSDFANFLDKMDPMKHLKEEFYIPCDDNGVYLSGNSLGLQPKNLERIILEELYVWKMSHDFGRPWVSMSDICLEQLSYILGCSISEIAVMNSLTCNLHLLMVSFYNPTKERYKILIESPSFPSDYCAIESQIRFHDLNPSECIIQLKPRANEYVLRHEDIIDCIEKHGDQISLILFSGINYYTGQLFDIKEITDAAHKKVILTFFSLILGCIAGFDLAHCVGNVSLFLHEWNVDFAAWCSYKYLNSGPGGISGIFVHQKHDHRPLKRLSGWWGHDKNHRFNMDNELRPTIGAGGYQLSNPCVLSIGCLYASMQVFKKTTMSEICTKHLLMSSFLRLLIEEYKLPLKIITPVKDSERGSQLSLLVETTDIDKLHDFLKSENITCDVRKPNVIRVAPSAFYNTFADCFYFAGTLNKYFNQF
ncbi:kynureninase [Rozella allomycis CSF55]|uniref:Kynureninase n=1 Tax=Rozella allomycis (strain CSF55) TaxID=988480 RepID=A0A4P9YEU3_ROZAC|nr:kynureninase [Rozella allomycis CSF55]